MQTQIRQIPRMTEGFLREPLCPLWFSDRLPTELSDVSFRIQEQRMP
jgi:hypothetical protein